MTIHKIKAPGLRAEGFRFETTDAKRAAAKLREVKARDPQAKLITIPGAR